MKNPAVLLVSSAVLIGLVWYIWFKPVPEQSEAAPLETEVPVHVSKIIRTSMRSYVSAYGMVDPEPAGELPAAGAHVAPALPGLVAKVYCREGQQVARGDILFQLDNRTAKVAVEFAKKTVDRQKKLLQVEGTSQKVLQEAEQQLAAARAQQALLKVVAPLDGTVTRVNVRAGEAVDLSTILAEVMDLDRLVVSAKVSAMELNALATGQPASVFTDTATSRVTGKLVYIGTEVAADTGTVGLRVSLPPGSGLRPGQFVNVHITSKEHENCLAVPEASIVKDENGDTVIAVVENGSAVQKVVRTGLQDGGLVEVEADGLQPDMMVVTEGAYALPHETRVRILEN